MVHMNKANISTAAQMWNSLKGVHKVGGQSAITAAKWTFCGTQAKDTMNIPVPIADMCRQQNKLHQMGCQISDEEFKLVLVMSLPPLCDHFVASYQGMHVRPDKEGEYGITSQELISVLIDKYQCHLNMATKDKDQSFYAQPTGSFKKRKVSKNTDTMTANKSMKKKCNICGRENHTMENCRYKRKPKCSKCGKFGHQTKKSWGDKPPRKGKECANIAQDEDNAEMSYVTSPVLSQNDHIVFFLPLVC